MKEVQRLIQGREGLFQSYNETDQSYISTAQELERLHREQIATEKAYLDYAEAMLNFKFPDNEYSDEPFPDATSLQDANIADWHHPLESSEPIPPQIQILSLSETSNGIELVISNGGDPVDALVSIADSHASIISNPYHSELLNWSDSRYIHFKLFRRDETIGILVEANGKHYKIPVFLGKQLSGPRLIAFPLEQSAQVGESTEYSLVVEGSPNDRQRYPIVIVGLPKEIKWQIVKVIPAVMPDSEPRVIPIRTLQFSNTFNRHELALRLAISSKLPNRLIGKPIPFTLQIGSVHETLSVTPLGIGELTIDVPATIQIRQGESKPVTVKLHNRGTETIEDIAFHSADIIYGISVTADLPTSLAPDEPSEVPFMLTIADGSTLGETPIRIILSSSVGSTSANFTLEIQPKAVKFASLHGLAKPTMRFLVLIAVLYAGMRFQQFWQKNAQEKAANYDLDVPNHGGKNE